MSSRSQKLKLVKIVRSTNPEKKYMAVFQQNGRTKVVHFGAAGYSDFTKHHDEERKQRYIIRHKAREHWDIPDTAGTLSLYILWNKPTIRESIQDYKKKFKL
jgi:hypothetical protein